MNELVDLPDPAVHPLVHPLDLPQARPVFRRSWTIGALTGLPVAVCVAVLVWAASDSHVVALIAGTVHTGLGLLTARHLREEAWAFVPRGRQDRQRRVPVAWDLAAALGFAALLAAALLTVTAHLADAAPGVREFTVGMGSVAALLVVADLVTVFTRRADRRQALVMLPAVVVVVVVVAAAYPLLLDSAATTSTLWWGVATMLIATLTIGPWRYGRRAAQEAS